MLEKRHTNQRLCIYIYIFGGTNEKQFGIPLISYSTEPALAKSTRNEDILFSELIPPLDPVALEDVAAGIARGCCWFVGVDSLSIVDRRRRGGAIISWGGGNSFYEAGFGMLENTQPETQHSIRLLNKETDERTTNDGL